MAVAPKLFCHLVTTVVTGEASAIKFGCAAVVVDVAVIVVTQYWLVDIAVAVPGVASSATLVSASSWLLAILLMLPRLQVLP